jgi:hypothetical protein
MQIHLKNPAILSLAALSMIGLLSSRATAQSHPQEVLDLIQSYEALAMKVRPLQDRVVDASSTTGSSAGFRPEGVPLRAGLATDTADGDSAPQRRVTERLRHRDRSVSSDTEYSRLSERLSALEQRIRSELERLRAPGFGAPGENDSGSVRFGDARSGARPSGAPAPATRAVGATTGVDEQAIVVAKRTLNELEREYAALERQVSGGEAR